MRERQRCCPECGSKLLAREGDKIICLGFNCEWEIESKRVSDKEIPLYKEIVREFNS